MNIARQIRSALIKGMAFGAGFCVIVAGIVLAQSLTSFTGGQVVSASAMNANFDALKTRMDALQASIASGDSTVNASIMDRVAPIGGIIAWHNTIGGVPTLPAGWVLCDGNPIADPDSPLDGGNTPNLNGAPNAWNAGGYYLRGSASAGITQVDVFQGHRHWRNTANAAEHDMRPFAGSGGNTMFGGPYFPSSLTITGDPVAGLNGAPRVGSETRPVSFLVVWIMRIK